MTTPMHFDSPRNGLQIPDFRHGKRLPVANDLVANSLTADMLRRLAAFTADDLTLQELHVELAAIDEHLKIPMESGVESLNLVVSAGVILFEARRQTSRE